ncbi:MAG: GTPase HflX [Alphaproteobacteria bacterium]|nr:GTPase HflX [Alphaproteobacteria bacterium]
MNSISFNTAVIIHPRLKSPEPEPRSIEREIEEVEGLAEAINLNVVHSEAVNLSQITPPLYLGKGTAERIKGIIEGVAPSVAIVNTQLSPVQQRNLENLWNVKVIDRTGLILEIFGARAQTKEGVIQVELAALNYQRSRLVRSWTHLERQRGGAGFMGGPGERQIEIDRRLIDEKITQLKKNLEKVRQTRELQRRSREQVPYPVVALVGYTNAGKSTLFNTLTNSDVFAEDLPFATLDPTMRALKLKNGQEVILSDTVGFITDLPTHLVEAFKATLEQVDYADVIVHVRDYIADDSELQKENVVKILSDLGVDYQADSRIIEVWNKIDLLPEDQRINIKGRQNVVPISALSGYNIDRLLEQITQMLENHYVEDVIVLRPAQGKELAWLHEHANVLAIGIGENGQQIVNVRIEPAMQDKFYKLFNAD